MSASSTAEGPQSSAPGCICPIPLQCEHPLSRRWGRVQYSRHRELTGGDAVLLGVLFEFLRKLCGRFFLRWQPDSRHLGSAASGQFRICRALRTT